MKRQIIAIILLIFIFSCKKEGIDYVRGTVVDNFTNEPIAGAEVDLICNPSVGESRTLERVLTDANGYYKINYSKIISTDYIVKCFDDNYSNRLSPIGTKLKHAKRVVNFSLIPQGFIKLRTIKTGFSNNSTETKIGEQYWFYPDLFGLPYNKPFDVTSRPILVDANKTVEVEWHLRDVVTGIRDSNEHFYDFTVNKGDTLLYTITFN